MTVTDDVVETKISNYILTSLLDIYISIGNKHIFCYLLKCSPQIFMFFVKCEIKRLCSSKDIKFENHHRNQKNRDALYFDKTIIQC